ncbi:MAG: META domain-containing protein, partial [Burkholderiales bacterium]|nr:META domain-containing protein [Burkholderiales bacterium]
MSPFRSGLGLLAACLPLLAVPAHAAPFAVKAPTTWQGILPCADCEGIRTDLTLHPGGSYVLHESYLGKGNDARVWTELGRWTGSASGKRLRLTASRETRYFGVVGERTLRMRDRQDRDIRSTLNYNLVRTTEPAPLGGELRVRGFYTYRADAALFLHCDSGRRFEVRGGARAVDLERAYVDSARGSGKPILATFDATLAPRPADAEGFDTIRVEGEPKLWPGATCATKAPTMTDTVATAGLDGRWTFTSIQGDAPRAGGRQRPGLELRDGRVAAATGCNRVLGRFKVDGAGVAFAQMASTMMACPPEEGAQERAIADVLARTQGWRMTGGTLVLTDAGGATLAELAAAVTLEGRWRFVDIAGQAPIDSPRGAP